MHALTILQRCLGPLLTGIHARRLAALLEAVAATVCGPRLTLTDIGRRLGGEASLRNKIKRLVGCSATAIYRVRHERSMARSPRCCCAGARRAADRHRLVGFEGGPVAASAARLSAGGRS